MVDVDRATAPAGELDGPSAPELDVLGAVAPAARAALSDAWEAAHRELEPELLGLARRRVEDQLALAPDPGPEPDGRLQQAVSDLTDQYVFYVPQVSEELRAPVREGLGEDGLRSFFDALYVLDQTARLRLTHARLFSGPGSGSRSGTGTRSSAAALTLAEANLELHARAMQLDRLDPLSTEIVRLRAANYHDCKT